MIHPLNVIAYTDGRPGHTKQTHAVLEALKRLTPVSTTTRALPSAQGWRRLILGLRAFGGSERSFAGPTLSDIDLIIGAGSTTHLPMIALKFSCRAKLATCMSPDPLLRRWFDLCFVPRHDQPPTRNNFYTTFGPPCLRIDGSILSRVQEP